MVPGQERLVRVDLGVRLADRYSLEERVASGGMAEVWRAWDEVLARTVAIKLVGATGRRGMAFRRRIRDEARSAAGLTHPRVVTIHDYGETEDGFGSRTPYIVMEFLTGETLAQRLTRGPLPAAEAARVCGQVAEALAAAHRAGIVHRDVKPANVFLTPDGVKVLDFGIARAMRGEPVFSSPFVWPGPWEAVEHTEPLDMAPYLAPEEDGDHAVEPSADVYALGVVLAESLTGTRDSGAAMPPGVPSGVADICVRCRSADPKLRPSAVEVARTLASAGQSASAEDATLTEGPISGGSSAPAEGPVLTGPSAPAEGTVSTGPSASTEGPAFPQSPSSGRSSAAEPGTGGPAAGDEVGGSGTRTRPHSGPIFQVRSVSEPAEQAAGVRGKRRPASGLLAAGGLALAVTALLIEVFVLMDPPKERRDLGARPASTSAGQSASGAPSATGSGSEVASGGAGAGMAMGGGAGARPGAADGTGALDSAADPVASPYPAGTGADAAGDTGSGSAGGTSSGADAATGRPRAAAETIRSLGQMASVVDQGFAAGEIRSDVAVDFNNLVTNLRNDLMAGSRVELGVRVADLRSKIYTRLREGALSHRYAEVLSDSLPAQVAK